MAKNRPEIDKDIMYSMIMPSAPLPQKGDEIQDSAPIAPSVPLPETPPPTPIFSKTGVQFSERGQTVLVNIMEQLVLDKLDAAFEKFKCCKCDRCKRDVAALALNRLTPKYIVSDSDFNADLMGHQMSAEITTAIVQAILIVRAHPRH